MASTFIFNANETPSQLAERKKRAQALLQASTSGVATNAGQGIAQLGQAVAGRIGMSMANRTEGRNMAAARKLLSGIGTPGRKAAPGTASAAPVSASPDLTSGIVSTAQALGIDPIDLGTAISYETAGTFDPMKKGPTTQWGQHKGLIQFGEPQAKEYGVDWSNPVGSQLGADGAVAKYLRKAGVQPGMGMLDIYSAINAGRVGKYGASDANNGGAPGTVADKVNTQMAGHRQKAEALLSGALGLMKPGTQTPNDPGYVEKPYAPDTRQMLMQAVPASAPPPGAPMPEQPPAMPPQAPQAAPQPQVQPAAAPIPPQAPQGPMSAYQRQMRNSMDRGGAPEAVARQMQGSMQGGGGPSMMQGGILNDLFGGNQGNVTAAPAPAMEAGMSPVDAGGGDRLAKLQEAMFSPWVAEIPGAQEHLQREYEREYQRMNPEPLTEMDRLKLERERLELEQLRTPKPAAPMNVPKGAAIYDPATKTWITPPAAGVGAVAPDLGDELKITKQFEDGSGVKRLREIQPIITSMEKSIDDNTGTADLDFIYGLAKIMDPESVVREGEMATVQGSSSIPEQYRGMLVKAINGQGSLTPQVRMELYTIARRRAEQLKQMAGNEYAHMSEYAKGSGMDPNRVLRKPDAIPQFQGTGDSNMRMVPPIAAGQMPQPKPQPAPDIPAPPGWEEDWQFLTPEERAKVLAQ